LLFDLVLLLLIRTCSNSVAATTVIGNFERFLVEIYGGAKTASASFSRPTKEAKTKKKTKKLTNKASKNDQQPLIHLDQEQQEQEHPEQGDGCHPATVNPTAIPAIINKDLSIVDNNHNNNGNADTTLDVDWWKDILVECPTPTTMTDGKLVVQLYFDDETNNNNDNHSKTNNHGGFHRLLLHAVTQLHGLHSVSRIVEYTNKKVTPTSTSTTTMHHNSTNNVVMEPTSYGTAPLKVSFPTIVW
jgi:hypothetical protein